MGIVLEGGKGFEEAGAAPGMKKFGVMPVAASPRFGVFRPTR